MTGNTHSNKTNFERNDCLMKNPMLKRIWREIKGEAGKYIVIFLFMTAIIAVCSGYLIADESLKTSYDNSFKDYNIEDGNFRLAKEADSELIAKIEENGVSVYNNFYWQEKIGDSDKKLRIFPDRKDVNKTSVWDGDLPESADEIAIDRVFAKNNKYEIGDSIEMKGKQFKIVGLIALPDYSALYENPNDFMFDSINFGTCVLSDDGIKQLDSANIFYSYSFKFSDSPKEHDSKEAIDKGAEFLEKLSAITPLEDYVPTSSNIAINFAGADLGRDRIFIFFLLYILIAIISFIFAVTTSNTIAKEATVIGTLRASGYTKAELIRHYMAAPVIVLLIASLVGNVLGYTVLKGFMANMYLDSYSLTPYKTVMNVNAFIDTTIIPIAILVAINLFMLVRKLSLSPLKFIRRDLKKRQRKKAFKLNTKINIMTRFRLRVLFQNIPNYITLFFGIFFANIIIIFCLMLTPVVEDLENATIDNIIATNQYVLRVPDDVNAETAKMFETNTKGAEKFSMTNLEIRKNDHTDAVNVIGFEKSSKYFHEKFDGEGVYISTPYAEKYSVKKGDTITLNEAYTDKEYKFKVAGIYEYPSSITVFADREYLNETLGKSSDYFSGYFSNEEITDINERLIASVITKEDLTKTTRQLKVSMGNLMSAFVAVGVVVFVLVIYMLAKVIIEKNTQSISVAKILGYNKREISGIYIRATTVVTILSLIISIPVVDIALKAMWRALMMEYSGWMNMNVPLMVYAETIALGVVTYALVALALKRKAGKVPMDEALKNVE